MRVIKGITWDHPRGYQPLRAVADIMRQQTGIETIWDIRSLKEFGDLPIEKLIERYDLLIIDHPYMGEAHYNRLLVPLNNYLEKEFLKIQEEQSVGPSFQSYEYYDYLYALPVDAAAQVSAFRKDLTEKLDWQLPCETGKLKEAAEQLPGGYFIGLPLCPTDIWCVFLSLGAQFSNGNFFSESGIDIDAGRWAFEQLMEWKSFIHKDSFQMNPIQIFEHMSLREEIIYCPFSFGYTNYSRKGFRKNLIHFCNVPQFISGGVTSLLGGAGIAISNKTNDLNGCLEYIKNVLNPEIQRTVYFEEGGQPAQFIAWQDEKCNRNCSNFFTDTIYSLSHAYVRPRVPGFNKFQEWAASNIHDWIINSSGNTNAIQQLNHQYYNFCHAEI